MASVISHDGTSIAYERTGGGPAVMLISGGLDDGAENAPLAAELARRFTVLNYARRGRGASGDTLPYAVEREFEGLAALLEIVDAPRYLYGTSSGGALAMEAAAAGLGGIAKIAVYEVPYNMSAEWPAQWRAYVDALHALDGPPGAALELFLRLTGASEADIAAARSSPFWAGGVALEHTLAYDAACLGSGQPDADRLANVHQPTLVLTGGRGNPPGSAPWIAALAGEGTRRAARHGSPHSRAPQTRSSPPCTTVYATTSTAKGMCQNRQHSPPGSPPSSANSVSRRWRRDRCAGSSAARLGRFGTRRRGRAAAVLGRIASSIRLRG